MTKNLRFNPRSKIFQSNPYDTYRILRDREPATRFGNKWLITRHEDVKSLLLSNNTRSIDIPETYKKYLHGLITQFPQHVIASLSKVLLLQEDDCHRLHKKQMMSLVTGIYMKELEEIINSVAGGIVEINKGKVSIEIMMSVARVLWSKIFARWLNIPDYRLDLFIEAQKYMRQLIEYPGVLSYDKFNKIIVIMYKTSLLCDDLLSLDETRDSLFYRALLNGYGGSHRDVNDNFFMDMINILIASSETNESLTGSLFLELAHDERLQQELRDNPEKIKLAINETMRLHPPVQITRRESTNALTIQGKHIPAGDILLLCLGSANRDEEVFKYAHHFDLNRKNTNQHVGFSAGAHSCLGQQLAIRQMSIICQAFLTHLPSFHLDRPEEWQIDNLVLRSLKSLHIKFNTPA